ncbi:hypothetical protein F4779DRAFT_631534 [Xylariaceae sp. FL0662B]|nr:hypothetical protein F4779DRAFT_631534 [Xylariaceae sp. FL0662B]
MASPILSYPPPAPPPSQLNGEIDNNHKDVLIFLITGNPGLIRFYEPFLSTLRKLIDDSAPLRSTRFHIYGQNFAGFSDDDHEPFTAQEKPHDIEYQIQHTLEALKRLHVESGPRKDLPYDDVLVMGHSVGAYVALELCHRVLRNPELAPDLNLSSGILLFPTIRHIAKSPNGLKLDLLRRTPVLGDNAYRVAQGFLHLLPQNLVHWIVHKVCGFSPHSTEVATGWLKSRDGVWQTLHMAMDEMKVIGEDRWDDELWEIAHDAEDHHKPMPKFFFFFGKDDQWVANHYRDEFIEKRTKQVERTRLVVDEEGNLPHAFCTNHSKTVAEKVKGWLNEMYEVS